MEDTSCMKTDLFEILCAELFNISFDEKQLDFSFCLQNALNCKLHFAMKYLVLHVFAFMYLHLIF